MMSRSTSEGALSEPPLQTALVAHIEPQEPVDAFDRCVF